MNTDYIPIIYSVLSILVIVISFNYLNQTPPHLPEALIIPPIVVLSAVILVYSSKFFHNRDEIPNRRIDEQ